jgi:guanine deaminase
MRSPEFMREAIRLAEEGMNSGLGGPFGCVIVHGDVIIATGQNRVTSTNDPTAHAEVVAIRGACMKLGAWELKDCSLYTSCEPCPMCLAAIYWARIPVLYYANTRSDAAAIGFDDDFIYKQMPLPPQGRALAMHSLLREEALTVFDAWRAKPDKITY